MQQPHHLQHHPPVVLTLELVPPLTLRWRRVPLLLQGDVHCLG
jgi:hypothetical protein